MAARGCDAELLLLHLRDSRCRFQKRMQRLIAKYDRPYEDSPLVQMSTLTYETSQGLRIWGGKLVDRSRGQCELAVPQSPLKNELRRKYLAQVELLLQDQGHAQGADCGKDKDIQGTWDPVLFSLIRPPQGNHSSGSNNRPGALVTLPCAATECQPSPPGLADPASVPRGLSFQEASGGSFLSSQSLEDIDLCEVTISDLYVGMLHSMSQLLSNRPACVISTKTSILQNWRPRWRARVRARMNRTYCRGRRALVPSPPNTCGPASEPEKSPKDPENLQQALRPWTRFPVEKELLAVSPGPGADWQGHEGTPPKRAPLTCTGTSSGCGLDKENQLLKLKWLISPLKLITKLQVLPGRTGTQYQEIRTRFAELHQEHCPSPRMPPSPAALPGSLVISQRPATAFRDAQARRLREAFKDTVTGSAGAARCLLPAPPSPSHGPLHPGPLSPGRLQSLGPSPRASRMSALPSPAHSSPHAARYREIKETFDRLHRELCGKAPAQAAVGPHSPRDASGKGGPPKSSSPCLRHTVSAEAQLSARCVHRAREGTEFPVKRRRLSAPSLCKPGDSSRPVKEAELHQPDDNDMDERKVHLGGG
nr:unnamed protein product [Sorex araneus]